MSDCSEFPQSTWNISATLFCGRVPTVRVVPTQIQLGQRSLELTQGAALRSVVKEHPQKSPHTCANRRAIEGIEGL